MEADVYLSRARLGPRTIRRKRERDVPGDDDIKVARRRMRHLVPWNVEPLPIMQRAFSSRNERFSPDARERIRRVALQVLAVQIWHTAATSALKR